MRKRLIILFTIALLTLGIAGCGNSGNSCADGDNVFANMKEDIFIGDTSIREYMISYNNNDAKSVAETLQLYIKRTCGVEIPLISKYGNEHVISVVVKKGEEEKEPFIEGGNVYITGPNLTYVLNQSFVFINTYMGWMFAGTPDEAVSDEKSVLHIPADTLKEEAWIEEREPIVTLWNTSLVRGNSYNENTSMMTDILTYSDAQLYEYVKMLKWCGYTGVQVTDICSSWVAVSGKDFVHDRIRKMADAAHSMNMQFTLWVWAANFDGFGWVDEDVTYDKGSYEFQYQNPDVVACFEKYYDFYAELADVCDRVITHFYDPGNLDTAEDVGFFSKMFMDKLHAKNPDIDFGISCWVDAFDLGVILSYTGTDVTVYEGNCQSDGGIDGDLRNRVYTFAARLGTWSWDTSHMEIDQLAAMQYQPSVIKEAYQQMKQFDEIMKPSYWSEMDSYHLLNAFTLYCTGALLQNPDIDPEALTMQVAKEAVGPEHADIFADMLKLIEKARSGKSWDSFWWENDNYILVSKDYQAEEIIKEVDILIPEIEKMIEADVEGYYMPTPFSMSDILRLIVPHLEQIKEYATFRKAFDELQTSVAAGKITPEEASETLYEISYPVHEYNTIIGTWGQIEARQQRILVLDFCEKYGIEVPQYARYNDLRKERIYNSLCMQQKGKKEPVYTWTYAANCAYHTEERKLIDELIEEGLFTVYDGSWYYLTDWQDYIYDFNKK